MGKPRKLSPEFKAKVMLEIVSGEKSLAQASRDYRIGDTVFHWWQAQFLEGLPALKAVVPTGVITIWITRMFSRFASRVSKREFLSVRASISAGAAHT